MRPAGTAIADFYPILAARGLRMQQTTFGGNLAPPRPNRRRSVDRAKVRANPGRRNCGPTIPVRSTNFEAKVVGRPPDCVPDTSGNSSLAVAPYVVGQNKHREFLCTSRPHHNDSNRGE